MFLCLDLYNCSRVEWADLFCINNALYDKLIQHNVVTIVLHPWCFSDSK